jgi:hypothetical protein
LGRHFARQAILFAFEGMSDLGFLLPPDLILIAAGASLGLPRRLPAGSSDDSRGAVETGAANDPD